MKYSFHYFIINGIKKTLGNVMIECPDLPAGKLYDMLPGETMEYNGNRIKRL